LFYTANDEQMDQKNIECMSHLSRGCWYGSGIRCLTTNDKELWSAIKPLGYIPNTHEKYQHVYNRECVGGTEGRLWKRWSFGLNQLLKESSRRLIMCLNQHQTYNGRVYKENFQTKVRIGSSTMVLFQYICKHAAAAILKGQKSLIQPKIIKCYVSYNS
jgi:hypothetical protein